ncbi:hypothetical protein IV203_002746 [Nitzschia inconspicua]|uniref:Uncharacterized protein n=1 Tax=Nitzschia inconspicua TaxID=303405 RepID=A0A9K3L1Z9_9STRA|nr:hypothetical protein IV203_002746 [Nitzschia inconspicua]
MDRAKSDIELLNSYLTKSVPLELEAGYNVDDTAGDAIAELDGEVGLGGRETGNDLGRAPACRGSTTSTTQKCCWKQQYGQLESSRINASKSNGNVCILYAA